jgi:hypothetical protein
MNKIVPIGLAISSVVFGAWTALDCAAMRSGYIASYSYVAAVSLAIICGCVGLPLAIWWRTRGVGVGLIATGVLSCATFYGGMSVLWRLDRVAWRYDRRVKMTLSDKSSLVIYLRREVTEKQAEEFSSSVLTQSGNSDDLPSFVRVYWRLTPDQANGHWGMSLYFRDDADPREVSAFVEKVKRDVRVDAVYTNTAPNTIPPQASSR